MRAIVTKEFRGIGDHDRSERYFAVGEVIYGALAECAVEGGNAKKQDSKPPVPPRKKPAALKAPAAAKPSPRVKR